MRRNIPTMPKKFIGGMQTGSVYVKTAPRKWTNNEIEWILNMRKDGYSMDDIAISTGRSKISVSLKLKRLGKKHNTYNKSHVDEKYEINRMYANLVKPTNILDLYCGECSFWSNSGLCRNVITNDYNNTFDADYHEKAELLIHRLYYEGKKYDVIDLDPFGSAYECFDLAIKMAKKGLIITFGELGHRRFRRLDYVGCRYGINNVNDFTLENLISGVQQIARQNKKQLEVVYAKSWHNIARVWFTIKPIKITDQWK